MSKRRWRSRFQAGGDGQSDHAHSTEGRKVGGGVLPNAKEILAAGGRAGGSQAEGEEGMSEDEKVADDDCYRCWDERTRGADIMTRLTSRRMFLCPTCGNKRCPKASDHRLACTGSNEPGQEGSIYA